MEILFAILRILFFPGLLFVAVGGLLLSGIDRKVLSRMQRRVGPPIVQPFYDFFKLMGLLAPEREEDEKKEDEAL